MVAPAQHEVGQKWNKRSHQDGAEIERHVVVDIADGGPWFGFNADLLNLRGLRRGHGLRGGGTAAAGLGGFLRLLLDLLFLLAHPLRDEHLNRVIFDFVQTLAGLIEKLADAAAVGGQVLGKRRELSP